MTHQFVIEELPPNPGLKRVFERARRNMLWLNDHVIALEIFNIYRGRFIAVSEGDIFVGDSPEEVEQLALAKHPEDVPHVRYIPRQKAYRLTMPAQAAL